MPSILPSPSCDDERSTARQAALKQSRPDWTDVWRSHEQETCDEQAQEEEEMTWVDGNEVEFQLQSIVQVKKRETQLRAEVQAPNDPHHSSHSSAVASTQAVNASASSTRSTRSAHSIGVVDFGFSPPPAQQSLSASHASPAPSVSSISSVSRTSSSASSVASRSLQAQVHTFVPVEAQKPTRQEGEMSLLESMHELSRQCTSHQRTIDLRLIYV
jgi:hypothetical protein